MNGTFTVLFRVSSARLQGWDTAETMISTRQSAESKAAVLESTTRGIVTQIIYEASDRELDAAAWVGDVLARTAAQSDVRRTQNHSYRVDVPGDADEISLSGARPVVSIWALVAA